MSKDGSKVGSGATGAQVGRVVLQIALPLEGAKEPASPAEGDRSRPSQDATPAGERRRRKRKWYTLYDKVFAVRNLEQAWEKVRANKGAPGCDGQSIEQFGARVEAELEALHEQLKSKRYRPRPVRRVEIAKPGGGRRRLGIPAVRDRVVQQAVLQILQPIFEAKFSEYSHGFRPDRGCATALNIVDRALRCGYEWVVDADIESFFDAVDHELLLTAVNEEIADGSVLRLIRMFLESGVMVGGGEVEPTELGTPQGGPLSPLLANIYLHPLDVAMQQGGFGLVRYADDFVIFTKTRERAEEALAVARGILESLKLRLHPAKTRIAAIDEGFDFLGFHYFRDSKGNLQKTVSRRSRARFREQIRKRTRRHAGQKRPKPRRCNARRLKGNQRVVEMTERVNAYLRGWHWYFKAVRTTWRDYFESFDGFVRRRIRCAISGRYAKGHWQSTLSNEVLEQIGYVRLGTLQERHLRGQLLAPPSSG